MVVECKQDQLDVSRINPYQLKQNMKPQLLKSLVCALGSFSLTICSMAQELIINLEDGQTVQYHIADIQSLKLLTNSLAVYENDGNIVTWDIAEIINYEFDLTGLSISNELLESNILKVYPNPITNYVRIDYSGRNSEKLVVDILTIDGKLITQLFHGKHTDQTTIIWDLQSAHIIPGTYFCRITSDMKVITRKIIVQ